MSDRDTDRAVARFLEAERQLALNAQVDALTRRSIDLDKLHIVTGPVTLQDVVRMLFTEFQIRPLRADWEARLAAPTSH